VTMTEKAYQIGDKTYLQRPLVLGQWQQLLPLLTGVNLSMESGLLDMIEAFGDRLPKMLAVVLTEQGKTAQGKDIESMAEEISFAISPEITFQVVDDFFICNPAQSIVSMLNRLTGMMGALRGKAPTGSPPSA